MSRYFILTGLGRTGTRFLAAHLEKGKDVEVRHDDFLPITREKALKRWREARKPVIISVSGTARYYLKEICDEFDPTVIFLWRDPVKLVRSHAELQIQSMRLARDECGDVVWPFKHEPKGLYLCRTAHILFGDLEASLALCKHHGIHIHHANMDTYTTSRGLIEMARFMGFNLNPGSLKPKNVTPFYDTVFRRDDFDEHVMDYLSSLTNALPCVADGYARSRGPSCVN